MEVVGFAEQAGGKLTMQSTQEKEQQS